MIKTLVKLAVVALIANASWRLFTVYSAHWKFVDAVEYTTQYRGDMSDEQVRERLLELAAQFDIPVTEESLLLTHESTHTIVDTKYARDVEVLPGVVYSWPFKLHVDTFMLQGAGPARPSPAPK